MSDWAPAEIAPGLWRWTAEHPEWVAGAEPESPGDWDRLVGSVACEVDDALVFIDALLPADRTAFWAWADDRARSRRVLALTTVQFHRRDRDLIVDRYGASTSRAAAALPAGIVAKPLRGAGEVAFWIEPHRALVFGDRVLGGDDGGLRLCPQSWLRYLGSGMGNGALRELLGPLLELPIERVVVSHGRPVLDGGREALRRAIG